jgi:hypothetical protein
MPTRQRLWILWLAAAALGLPATARAGARVVPLVEKPDGGRGGDGVLRIYGARNGVFSGKLVAPLGTRASAPRLSGPGALPAEAVTVRYTHPDGLQRYHKTPPLFDGLHPEPPGPMAPSKYYQPYNYQPIWLTVRVSADAKPGKYTGTWSVGGSSVKVELQVVDWKVPDPADFVTHSGFVQSPDSVAMHYGVEMWSDRHWKLIEESFKRLAELGAKSLYITLQRRTHLGNPHSMVHWTRNGQGLKPDLTVVGKYIDLAVEHMGKLPVVCLYVWEMDGTDASHFPASMPLEKRQKDREVLISVKNGAKLEEAKGPKWGSPEAAKFWKPVFDGIHKKLEEHGIGGSLMVGISGDYVPSPQAVKDISAAAPADTKWVCHAHGGPDSVQGVKAAMTASVWGIGGPADPKAPRKWKWQKPRYYGWKRDPSWRLLAFPRYGCFYGGAVSPFTTQPLAVYRSLAEGAMTASGKAKHSPGCLGYDRLGADFWPVLKDARGRASPICGRYPECAWGQLKISTATAAILAPGKDGAVASERFEMVREGLQETEARVFLEKALDDAAKRAKLGKDADRIQKLLDDRTVAFRQAIGNKGKNWAQWPGGERWHKSSADLYAAAAEVAKKLGK